MRGKSLNSKKEGEGHYSVVLLRSVSATLRAEKLLLLENIPIKLIPVPKHLSSDCGICVRFERSDQQKVEAILSKANLEVQSICPL